MNTPTKEQIKATVDALLAFRDIIKAAKEIPNGELYARVMGYMDLQTYTSFINALKDAGVVRESNFVLTWVEPKPLTEKQHNAFPKGRW